MGTGAEGAKSARALKARMRCLHQRLMAMIPLQPWLRPITNVVGAPWGPAGNVVASRRVRLCRRFAMRLTVGLV